MALAPVPRFLCARLHRNSSTLVRVCIHGDEAPLETLDCTGKMTLALRARDVEPDTQDTTGTPAGGEGATGGLTCGSAGDDQVPEPRRSNLGGPAVTLFTEPTAEIVTVPLPEEHDLNGMLGVRQTAGECLRESARGAGLTMRPVDCDAENLGLT